MARPPLILVLALEALLGGWPSGTWAGDHVFHHENVLGTSLELHVRADSPADAAWAENRVLAEIDRLAAIFSGYDPTSEFARWQARPAPSGPVPVSPELFEVLQACDRWREWSGGAFDPRVQVLTQLWTRCARENRPPTTIEKADALAVMARPAWHLDPAAGTAERRSDCPLSLNAIAKGDIIERACAAALDPRHGVRGLLLNVGGDLRAAGELTATVAIAPPGPASESAQPIATLTLNQRAVATSGHAQRGFRIQGNWYSHILDPRTGQPAAGVAAATVVAEHGQDADALATILNVLDPEEGLRLADSLPNVACLIVTRDGRIRHNREWGRYAHPGPVLAVARPDPPPATKPAAGAFWGDEFELVVKFEINQPREAGGRYRRPYVAIWVENQDGFPIRTILLWLSQGGAGFDQWLPQMKRWYNADRARLLVDKADLAHTISLPTRPPGTYSAIWDGKDDHGKPVPPGTYTLFIEAAREHGTNPSIRKTITVDRTPFDEELKGNVEIKSATVTYRRKSTPK